MCSMDQKPLKKALITVLLSFWCRQDQQTEEPHRPPLIFHQWKTCIQSDLGLLSQAVVQICLVAATERLLLIFNKCKAPIHAVALSVLSVHHRGTFELTDLTLAVLLPQLRLRWQQPSFLSHLLPSVRRVAPDI